jgi:hypothetical protein
MSYRSLNWIFCTLFAALLLFFAAGCDDAETFIQPNSIRMRLNGELWESQTVQAVLQEPNPVEVQFTFTARGPLNEIVFIRIRSERRNLIGVHRITNQASGNALAYTRPGAPGFIETHSSFQCAVIGGTVWVDFVDFEEGTISGRFSGTVCEILGNSPITYSSGEFFQLRF